MNNPVVIIVKKAAGNDSVGEMWDETKIFDESATLGDVLAWVQGEYKFENKTLTRETVIISRPDGSE